MSDSDQKNGVQQAAAFLLTLDKDGAAAVLRHLDPTVIVEVVEAMGDVDASSLAPDGVRELYHLSTQLVAVLILPFATVLALYGKEILLVWTGDQVIADNTYWILSVKHSYP